MTNFCSLRRLWGRPCFGALSLLVAPMLLGCQGMTITGLQAPAMVRVVQASPDAPPMDIRWGEQVLVYGVMAGSRSSYVPVDQGSAMLKAETTGTRQTLGGTQAALAGGRLYTLVVGSGLGSLQLTLLPDLAKAPASEALLRLVNQSARAEPLEVYLIRSGKGPQEATVKVSLDSGAVAGHGSVPPGTYSVAVLPAGTAAQSTSTSLLTGPQMRFAPGSARTIVLLDGPVNERTGRPTVQAIVNEEADESKAAQ